MKSYVIVFCIFFFAPNLYANNLYIKFKDFFLQQISFACETNSTEPHSGLKSASRYNFVVGIPAKEINRIIILDEVPYNKQKPIDYLSAKYFKYNLLETNDDELIIFVKDLIYEKETHLKINRITGGLWQAGQSVWFPIGECKRGSFKPSKQKF
tara:strand:- start:53 stop:514 length:462 start_codon:yes stop_codon:yes gene_type:complete